MNANVPSKTASCRILTDLHCELGEGLLWDSASERLLMTDILQGQLIEIDLQTHHQRTWRFEEPLAWVLSTPMAGQYLLGLQSGIALFDCEHPQALKWINQTFPGNHELRLNDACTDTCGKIWYGSMNMAHPDRPDGQLASISALEGLQIHDQGFTVTNGPVLSADGRALFFNDTLQGRVYRYSLCPQSGQPLEREVFMQFDPSQGCPDGMVVDAEGHLWIALWGGAAVVQLSLEGEILKKIAIPALNVTNLCFCGPQLDRLVVSTASMGMDNTALERYPNAGFLFEIIDHGSTGLPSWPARLETSWT